MQRKLISFDWAIKRILRNKINFEILEGFLSELLFDNIIILEVLEGESNQDSQDDKFNRLDIKVKNSKKEIILIEIQYSNELDYLQRILYASSKSIVEHMLKGKAFAKVSKIISISILYFDFGDGDDYIYKGTTNFVGLHNHTKLKLNQVQQELYKTDSLEKIYPEYYLIKVKNFNDSAKDTLDDWINFIKNEEIPNNTEAKGLLKAKETLDYLKMNSKERFSYNKYQNNLHHQASIYDSTYIVGKMKGIKKGKIEGKKEGKIEGRKEGKIEEKTSIAKKLIKAKVNMEVIKASTGLTDSQLTKLINIVK